MATRMQSLSIFPISRSIGMSFKRWEVMAGRVGEEVTADGVLKAEREDRGAREPTVPAMRAGRGAVERVGREAPEVAAQMALTEDREGMVVAAMTLQ